MRATYVCMYVHVYIMYIHTIIYALHRYKYIIDVYIHTCGTFCSLLLGIGNIGLNMVSQYLRVKIMI